MEFGGNDFEQNDHCSPCSRISSGWKDAHRRPALFKPKKSGSFNFEVYFLPRGKLSFQVVHDILCKMDFYTACLAFSVKFQFEQTFKLQIDVYVVGNNIKDAKYILRILYFRKVFVHSLICDPSVNARSLSLGLAFSQLRKRPWKRNCQEDG